jgi:hypothetical protein
MPPCWGDAARPLGGERGAAASAGRALGSRALRCVVPARPSSSVANRRGWAEQLDYLGALSLLQVLARVDEKMEAAGKPKLSLARRHVLEVGYWAYMAAPVIPQQHLHQQPPQQQTCQLREALGESMDEEMPDHVNALFFKDGAVKQSAIFQLMGAKGALEEEVCCAMLWLRVMLGCVSRCLGNRAVVWARCTYSSNQAGSLCLVCAQGFDDDPVELFGLNAMLMGWWVSISTLYLRWLRWLAP